MKGAPALLLASVATLLAVILQVGIATRYGVWGTHAHVPLLVLGFSAMYSNRRTGILAGFFVGLLEGSVAGANLWQYVLTRVLVAAAISSIAEGGIERNFYTSALFAGCCVICAEITFMFLAPPPQVLQFLGDTIRTAVYNGVLAMLLYALFNRILSPRR